MGKRTIKDHVTATLRVGEIEAKIIWRALLEAQDSLTPGIRRHPEWLEEVNAYGKMMGKISRVFPDAHAANHSDMEKFMKPDPPKTVPLI